MSQIPVSGNIGFFLLFGNVLLPLLVRSNKTIDFIGFNKKLTTLNQIGLLSLTFFHVEHSEGTNILNNMLMNPTKNISFILYALSCFIIFCLLYLNVTYLKQASLGLFLFSFVQLGLSFVNLLNSEFSAFNMSNQYLSIAFFLNWGTIAPQSWVAEYFWKSSS